MLGQVTNGKNLTIPDMNLREMAMFLPLIAWAIWIGVYPKPYFEILRQPVTEIVQRVKPHYFDAGIENAAVPSPPGIAHPMSEGGAR
jgi:NADH-quinone oxidoreductase subunit M